MAEVSKVARVDLNEEEQVYLIKSLNVSKAVVSGHIMAQIEGYIDLKTWLYLDGGGDDGRAARMNEFHQRLATLVVGPEVVAQALKDMESEASAKGWKKCPDCGGYHA